jgi:pullulanase
MNRRRWVDLGKTGRWAAAMVVAGLSSLLLACGGGNLDGASGHDATLDVANSDQAQTVLVAAPDTRQRAQSQQVDATTLRIHYRRDNGDTTGWQVHSWGAAQDPGWNQGWNPTGSDSFGAVYDIPLVAQTGDVGYLIHQGDNKDFGGADQRYTLHAGANEIWRLQGDNTTYSSNPLESPVPDITTVRVHYLRYQADHGNWGLHLWNGSGLDSARLPGVPIENWNAPVPFASMPGYQQHDSEVVFDIPVLNPQADNSRTALEFIIHGMPPNEGDKDGRNDNIRVAYAALNISNQVGQIWLVQQDATVYTSPPDLRQVSSTDARAVWLNSKLLQWPHVAAGGVVRLYHSATGQIVVQKDAAVTGADGYITLDLDTEQVPADAAERFKYVAPGAVFRVKDADLALLGSLHTRQLVLVQQNDQGLVQNATTGQIAGALDDLYSAATSVPDLGVSVQGGETRFKLWAPTAQKVALFLYPDDHGPATGAHKMLFDPSTGIWSLTVTGDLSGQYYRFAVRTVVRGVGLVRNLVTDPYSLSLSANSQRSYVANLADPRLKPEGWDSVQPPATVQASPDMSVYELHVRDFSANDQTVKPAWRGKYLAFTAHSDGMRHLRALAQAGMTDVHLMPTFDIASVPEKGCVTPSPAGAPDAETQQAAVAATAGQDCFNWGYDPWHFTAPEGSYASKANDGARRIVEFRQMVMALNQAGLRVGMDMVYNHTSASGQNDRSVLDRVVPGYYHRLNAVGGVEQSTCCENTATENHMMGKLMIDSVSTWARDYHISSLRFDIMGHQPRSVMEDLKAKVAVAAGRPVQLFGEGWNFGEVANGARFVQASMWSLNGSGIGSFAPFARDAVRGGSPFDGGNNLIANQGYINGLWYAPNAQGGGRSKTDLMWQADIIKAGLAGSIRSYTMQTHWDATLPLEQINVYDGQPAGFVTDPSEVVNYVENHDNQTLFDTNAFKLPLGTTPEDRARVQMLGAAINSFSQGIAYFHAGVDTLRSKSLDRNSYNAGDWFNRLDWSYTDNNFGVGLPLQSDNGDNWFVMRPLLANANIKPAPSQIAWTRDAFRDLLKIRASTSLLRLRSADDIKQRLSFHNTGSQQDPTVLVGDLNGVGYPGANFSRLVYLVNVDVQAKALVVPALQGQALKLHPVHRAAGAADQRAASASFDASTATFQLPARTAVVFVAR